MAYIEDMAYDEGYGLELGIWAMLELGIWAKHMGYDETLHLYRGDD